MAKVLCPECKSINENNSISCENCSTDLDLKNKYFLLKIIKKSNIITYLAYDKTSKSKVIIKEFSLLNAEGWDSHNLFKKEGDILAQLNHPSIPKFIEDFEIGIGDSSKLYIVMEYINGMNLKEEQRKNRYTEEEVIEDILEIAETLEYLHKLIPPVIHQDLNLSNIMRRKNGSLALIDFNAVKDVVVKNRSNDITGTFGFIAPEQLMGETVTASDYYSLGVVILVLLTRKEVEQMLDEENNLNWKDSIHASDKIIKLLNGLLIKDPKKRIQSLKEIEQIVLDNEVKTGKVEREEIERDDFKLVFEDNNQEVEFENFDNIENIDKENQKQTIKKNTKKNTENNTENNTEKAKLRVLSGIKKQDFIIKKERTLIGRIEKCDLTINHVSISKKHCIINQIDKREFTITDINSTHGVKVNGKKITPNKVVTIYFGDELKIGKVKLKLISKNYSSINNKSKSKNKYVILTTSILIILTIFIILKSSNHPTLISNSNKTTKAKKSIKKIESKFTIEEQYQKGKKFQENKDYNNANINFKESCSKGYVSSCELLAWNYEKGLGMKKDLFSAKIYYSKACNKNSGYSCNKMGYFISKETENKNKFLKAKTLYKKSCELKFGLGCKNLGDLYKLGKGVRKNKYTAKKYYKKACKLGYKKACK